MKKNKKSISFIISPKGFGKSIQFSLSTLFLKISFMTFFCLLIIAIAGTYISYDANFKQAAYQQLKRENKKYQQDLKDLDERMDVIKVQISSLIEKEQDLKGILGPVKSRKKKKIKNRHLIQFNRLYNKITQSSDLSSEKLSKKLAIFQDELYSLDDVYTTYLERGKQIRLRYASTPSIRPAFGRIMSRYGWRRHPITRKRKHHQGIDIASWTGAPIQSTGDGIVEYSGWSRTFGFVVVVDHDYGYRTVYAHCSQVLVSKGESVKKGQVIAQVGSTGLSTGPHLHYEVRKWRKSVNPLAFLDLDMFTARDKVW